MNILLTDSCSFIEKNLKTNMAKIVEYFITNKPKNKIMNIALTQSISLYEIAQIINEIYEYTGDNSLLLRNILSLKFILIKEGLEKLYKYNKNNLSIIQGDK